MFEPSTDPIIVSARINAPIAAAWECYTQPQHITQWNFADPSWHCPHAENTMEVGGRYLARMEAKDGSFGFDFEAVYESITPGRAFTYGFGGRTATVNFDEDGGVTMVTVSFTPEEINSRERQQQGWQAILDNYARYAEAVTTTTNS